MREAATREWQINWDDGTGVITIQYTARPKVGPVVKAVITCTELSAGLAASETLLTQVNDKRFSDLVAGVTYFPVGKYVVDATGESVAIQPPLL